MAELAEGPYEVEVERIALRGDRRRRRSTRSTPVPTACPTPGSCCTPTSWGSARCSTTCAGGSPRTASRCARPSRSPVRRPTMRARRRRPRDGAREGARRRHCSSATSRRGRLPRRARRRERGRGPRVLHGRDVRAEGGGDRAVRPGGRVLRDDPGARGLGGPEPARAARDRGRRRARRSRSSAADDHCTPRRRHRGAARRVGDRPDCEIVVYDERRPRLRARRPTGRRTGPTTPPTRGAACCVPAVASPDRDRRRGGGRRARSGVWRGSSSASRSRMW